MFNTGDSVVHPKHGSGIVTKKQTMQIRGTEREYFCIELLEGGGSLMIPVERLEEAGLREPIQDMQLLQQIMDSEPETLVDDAHVRQASIEEKITSGSVNLLIQAVRDLCWRETVQHLSQIDKKLKEDALSKIMQELSLNRLLTRAAVREGVNTIIQQAMQLHLSRRQAANNA